MNDHPQRLVQAIQYLAGNLGHELNNRLTVVLGNCDVAKRLAPTARQPVAKIEVAARNMSENINQLTKMASRLGGARRKTDLWPALAQSIEILAEEFGPTTVIDYDTPNTRSTCLRMDPDSLTLALYFMIYVVLGKEENQVRVTAAIEKNDMITIRVGGKNSQISPDLVQLLDPCSPEIILGEDVAAVGLSVAKAFAHRCQGQIAATCAENLGTEITMTLPIAQEVKSFLSGDQEKR